MNALRKKLIVSAFIIAVSAIFFCRVLMPEGAVSVFNIVSYCVGDAGSGKNVLLAISGDGRTEDGERYGQRLLVCDDSAEKELKFLGRIPPDKILNSIDLSSVKPIKIQLGDVNGDGVNEVSVCVYKTAVFHPVMAKRPFFLDLVDGVLIPVWQGSRLSRPFDDYILRDIDLDGIKEIVSVEYLEDGERVIAAYNWEGFGFEMVAQSDAFNGELQFVPDCEDKSEVEAVFSNSDEHYLLKFHLKEDKLEYRKIEAE